MTIELLCLVLTSLWLASLWPPYVFGVAKYDGHNIKANFQTPPDPARLPSWVQRTNRAHLNLVEQFAPFAAIVIVLNAIDVSNPITEWACISFLVLRILHSILMWMGFNAFPARPIVFTGAWICILALGWQAIF